VCDVYGKQKNITLANVRMVSLVNSFTERLTLCSAGAKVRPGGGRKSSQKAGGYGRNRGGSSGRPGVGAGMQHYRQNGRLSLDDISESRPTLQVCVSPALAPSCYSG